MKEATWFTYGSVGSNRASAPQRGHLVKQRITVAVILHFDVHLAGSLSDSVRDLSREHASQPEGTYQNAGIPFVQERQCS